MIKAIKVQLKPNNKQNSLLFQCAGTARFAYNWAIAKQEENYKNGGKFLSDGILRKELTQLKQGEFAWLYKYRDREPNYGDAWFKAFDMVTRENNYSTTKVKNNRKLKVFMKRID